MKLFVGYSPFYIQHNNESHYLLWSNEPSDGTSLKKDLLSVQYDWSKLNSEKIYWPLLSKGSQQYYPNQEWRTPLSSDSGRFHFLGTFDLGRDLFSSCLIGMQKSLLIALLSILIAIMIGIPLGASLPFLNLMKTRVSLFGIILMALLFLVIFYITLLSVDYRFISFTSIVFILICVILMIISLKINLGPSIKINTDQLLMNGIVLIKSVPMLLVLLLLIQLISKPGVLGLSLIIGIYLSLSFAKYARYLTINLTQESFVQSLVSLGIPKTRIILYHLIPSVLRSLFPYICLSIASVILAEASISYLGLGLPIEELSLGSIMQSARSYTSAWWVVLFPGLCVFWMVYTFQMINEANIDKIAN